MSIGDFSTILRSIKIAIATFIIVQISFQSIRFAKEELSKILDKIRLKLLKLSLKSKYDKISPFLQLPLYFPKNNRQKKGKALISEIVIVTWLLTALFFLGQSQGKVDAIRDARNETSLLPVVTLIAPKDTLPLGRNIFDLTDDPNRSNFRAIGDIELYEQLIQRDYNNKSDDNIPKVVWRLLFDGNSQYYIFPSIPKNSQPNARPPVLVIQQSEDGKYILILSPETPPQPKQN
ncbi:MAG: hypothetical protein J7F05_13025 [Trichodesmium erythraeum GBRTRLIN201]|nr:hypothetical protein [Trichodesmium erythraeum GBRTRLIN201]